MNKLDNFEESLKNSMEGFEVPYNSADWDKLSQELDGNKGGYGSSTALYVGLLAGALMLGGTLFYTLSEDNRLSDSNSMIENVSEVGVAENPSNSLNTSNFNEETYLSDVAEVNDQTSEVSNAEVDDSPDKQVLDRSVNETGVNTAKAESDLADNQVVITGSDEPTPNEASISNNIENAEIAKATGKTQVQSTEKVESRESIVAISTHAGVVNASAFNSFSMSRTGSCEGSAISFKLDAVDDGSHYLWNFGDGSFSNEPEPEHVYGRPGKYQVTLVRTGGQGGKKIQSRPTEELVEIHASPNANFKYVARKEQGKLPFMHFENLSTSAKECVWDFGDGSTSKLFHPNHVYRKSGDYQVNLKVLNANGCVDEFNTTVNVSVGNPLDAAETFSPNGDGVKDSFLPEALESLNAPFKLTIYETTGAPIFTSYSANEKWDGTLQNGSKAPANEYVWMVNFLEGEYADMTFQGRTNLIR